MFIPRRVVAFGVLTLLAATLFAPASARPPAKIPTDRDVRRQLEAAETAIRADEWEKATAALDFVLSIDRVVRLNVLREVDGREQAVIVSAQQEAERLLAALPAEGRQVYEQTVGARAAAELKTAREEKDAAKLQRVVDRYLYTNAGIDALQELAAWHGDHGNYDLAALHYERLLRHRGLARWAPAQLIKATIAFRNANNADNAAIVTRELLERAGEGTFPLGATRAELQKELDKLPNSAALAEWRVFGGNPMRNGRGIGGPPALTAEWKIPLARTAEVVNWVTQAKATLVDRNQPILPGSVPVTVLHELPDGKKQSLVIFRSHWGIHAVDVKNPTRVRWETPSAWSLDRMVRDTKKVGAINGWMAVALSTQPNVLIENSTIGTLSTDGVNVYMIEDIEVPPAKQFQQNFDNPNIQQNYGDKTISGAVNSNKLMAFDVAVGKLKWETGGPATKDQKVELADCYFLGAPLAFDGDLYVAIELANSRLSSALLFAGPSLAALPEMHDPREIGLAVLNARTGKVKSVTPLSTHRHSIADEPRRGQAVQLAYGYGVFVCCAHTGTIIGVDRGKNRVLWSHTYRQPPGTNDKQDRVVARPDNFVQGADDRYYDPAELRQWHLAVPVIADGKVIVTAANSPELLCLDVRTGVPLWSVPRGNDDLYLAGVFHSKALVVGKSYIRAVTLADGKEAWRTATGLPSGFGTFTDTHYYLPLQSAVSNKEPEICILDADKGTILAHNRSGSTKTKIVPGNLVFFQDELLSLTPTEITAYPVAAVQLQKVNEVLKKMPNDPEGLYYRARLRENVGDLTGAVDDLRTALKNDREKGRRETIRSQLFETLTELLRQDFDKNDKYLKDYEDSCIVNEPPPGQRETATEQRRRRITFLIVAGLGREKQGKSSEALQFYLDLAALNANELETLVTDPDLKIRLDRWALGRIEEMLKKVSPEQRKQLEQEMLERWKKSKTDHRDADTVKFVAPILPSDKALSDRDLRRKLEAAEDAIRAEHWEQAATLLDAVLSVEREAVLTLLREDGDKERVVTGVLAHQEAERILAALPEKGRAVYESKFDDLAKSLLDEARQVNDLALLRRIVRIYRYTLAGREALRELAGRLLERGQSAHAAIAYKQALQELAPPLWTPSQLYQARMAFRAVGDRESAAVVQRELLARADKAPVLIGSRKMTRADLQKEVDPSEPPRQGSDWQTQRVHPERNGRRIDVEPVLEPTWRTSLLRTDEAKKWFDMAEEALAKQNLVALPGATPLAVEIRRGDQMKSLAVFRSHWGIHAVDINTGKIFWETPSLWSFDRMVSDTKTLDTISKTVAEALEKRPQALFENSIIGTLSTDGVYVYMVEDFELTPASLPKAPKASTYGDSEIANAIDASKLRAFELATGKFKWEVGGSSPFGNLTNSHFLGTPLALGDKLYVAVESKNIHVGREVRLAVLDARTGTVLAEKPLFSHNEPLMPATRRLHAVQLVYGDGALICCANTGTVVAFDLITERLRWLVRYRDNLEDGSAVDADSSWVATAPVISGDKLILGAADSTKIHCLNLHDGSRVWSTLHQREDMYVAGVFQGKVLFVGQYGVRAFTLERRDLLWEITTGTISGFGVAADGYYYLPLKGKPGIGAINLKSGDIDQIPAKEAPGNLLFSDGYLLSLTPRTMTAYPQATTHLKTLDETLRKTPNDLTARRQRCQLHRFRGETYLAAFDLRAALNLEPDDEKRSALHDQLFESLQALFYDDAAHLDQHWKEFADTIIVDFDLDAMSVSGYGKTRPRQLHFLMTIALNHEKTRHFGEAARYYLAVFKAADADEMLSLPQTPETQVRLDMWAQTRLEELLPKLTPAQRQPIQDEIKKREK